MKVYEKPEIELVEFSVEAITTGDGPGMGTTYGPVEEW